MYLIGPVCETESAGASDAGSGVCNCDGEREPCEFFLFCFVFALACEWVSWQCHVFVCVVRACYMCLFLNCVDAFALLISFCE